MARPKGTKNKFPSKKRIQQQLANNALLDETIAVPTSNLSILQQNNPLVTVGTSSSNNIHILPLPKRTIGGLRDQVLKVKQCNCKRSSCLKLYCECFAAGICCSESCCCLDCHNLEKVHNAGRNVPVQKKKKLENNVDVDDIATTYADKDTNTNVGKRDSGDATTDNTNYDQTNGAIEQDDEYFEDDSEDDQDPVLKATRAIIQSENFKTPSKYDPRVHLRCQSVAIILDRNPHAFRSKASASSAVAVAVAAVKATNSSTVPSSSTTHHMDNTSSLSSNNKAANNNTNITTNITSTNNIYPTSSTATTLATTKNTNPSPQPYLPKYTALMNNTKITTKPSSKTKGGCNCKKSFCLKKYCDCFQATLYCNIELCRCQSCQNKPGNPRREQLISKSKKREEEKESLTLAALKLDSANVVRSGGVGGGDGEGTNSHMVGDNNALTTGLDGIGGDINSSGNGNNINGIQNDNALGGYMNNVMKSSIGGLPLNLATIISSGVAAAGVDLFSPASSYTQPMQTKSGKIVSELAFGIVGKQDVGGGNNDIMIDADNFTSQSFRSNIVEAGMKSVMQSCNIHVPSKMNLEIQAKRSNEELLSYCDSMRAILNSSHCISSSSPSNTTNGASNTSARSDSTDWNDFVQSLKSKSSQLCVKSESTSTQSKSEDMKTQSKSSRRMKRSFDDFACDTIIGITQDVKGFKKVMDEAEKEAENWFDSIVSKMKLEGTSGSSDSWFEQLNAPSSQLQINGSEMGNLAVDDDCVRRKNKNNVDIHIEVEMDSGEATYNNDYDLYCQEIMPNWESSRDEDIHKPNEERLSDADMKEKCIIAARETALFRELATMLRERALELAKRRRRCLK